MIGVIIVTHGKLAEAFVSVTEHVVGKQQNMIAIEDDRSHADDRPFGVGPHRPITFTMTRFFRWPSNSA